MIISVFLLLENTLLALGYHYYRGIRADVDKRTLRSFFLHRFFRIISPVYAHTYICV